MKQISITFDTLGEFFDRTSYFKKKIILLILGALSALSFAPYYFFPSYIISLSILLIITMRSRTIFIAFSYGYNFGIGHFFAGLYWIGNSFAVEPDVPDWAGYLMVFVLSSLLALFIATVTGLTKYIHKNNSLKLHSLNIVLSFTVLWSVAEWLRGNIFTGFPWNLSGYLWGFSDIILQSTALWGIYGLGVITVFLCLIPLVMFDKKYRISVPFFGALVVFGLFYYGDNRLPETLDYVEDVNIRVVQTNLKQQDKWTYKNWGKNLIDLIGMSEGNEMSATTHVIWPETSVIYSLSEEPFRRQLISQILKPGGTVITGFPRRQRDPDRTSIFNSVIAFDDRGKILGTYDKTYLVPFGEYMLDFIRVIIIQLVLDELFTGGQDFVHGEGLKIFNIEGLPPVGLLICYEVIFPGQVVDPDNRPDWLLNLTNDAWYGDSTGPRQHLLQTRVRAIEEGLPLVRSASTGISAIIDPYGRILHQLSLNERGVINGELPRKISTETKYSYYKEWLFACINIILIIANIVIAIRIAPLRR